MGNSIFSESKPIGSPRDSLFDKDVNRRVSETEKLEILFHTMPMQVWYLNDINTYGSANKAHADFIGMKKEDLVLRDIKDIRRGEEADICIKGNEKVFREKTRIVTKSWLHNSNGEKKLLRITKNPKLNQKGEIDFVVCSAEDITDQYISKEQNYIKERILHSSIDFTKELLTNDDLYDALSKGIEMLGSATQVDRVYYWENHYDKDSDSWLTSQKIEWCLGNIEQQINNPELQNIPFEEVGDFIEQLSNNKSFNSHIRDITDKNSNAKKLFEAQGILSILVIPVFVNNEFKGFIGFDSCNMEKEWSKVEISLLKSFALLYEKASEKKLLEKRAAQAKDNFNNFFDMIDDLLFVLDLEGKIIDVNDTALDRLNYSRNEIIGESVLLLHPEDKRDEAGKSIAELMARKSMACNVPAITKDGVEFPVETRVTEGIWNEEKVFFAVAKDRSELSMSEEKFSKAFNNSGISMFISKAKNGEIIDANDSCLDLVGYERCEIIGKTIRHLDKICSGENQKAFREELAKNNKLSDMEVEISCKGGVARKALISSWVLTINSEVCLLSSIVDITERSQYEEKLLELSNRDYLTGIYNRRYVYERLEEIIEEYKRNDKFFSVCIIDIDDFKEINDTFGHQAGDFVLVELAEALNENLRLYDMLGRFGGEEFIFVINHCNGEDGNLVLERLLDIIRAKIFIVEGKSVKLTFSAGIAGCEEFAKNEIDINKLVGLADKRMYSAKNSGKNKIVYTDPLVREDR